MKRPFIFRILLIIVLISAVQNADAQIKGFGKIKWVREKIAPGLIWKTTHTLVNDSIPQNINLLIINLEKRDISLFYKPEENIIVRKQAEGAGALAAVNAGFFNIRDGGSVTYIKTGGLILDTDTAKKWTRYVNLNGSVLIDINNQITIDRARTNDWYDIHPEYHEVVVTGPLLLSAKQKFQLPSTSLVTDRHPRTVIGIKGAHRLVILTIDGRTDQSTGMTLTELTDLMLSLKCKDAVNLDGGGSTTMWIAGKSFNGVVNMPCDNRKFDHEGERAVSDILIIK